MHLPHPSTVLTDLKEEDRLSYDSILSGQLGSVNSDHSAPQPQLPSIGQEYDRWVGYADTQRRPSESSVSSVSSASSTGSVSGAPSPALSTVDADMTSAHPSVNFNRRLRQLNDQIQPRHVEHYQPYPFQQTCPPLAQKNTKWRGSGKAEYSANYRSSKNSGASSTKKQRNPKAEREAKARQEQSRHLSNMQNTMLMINPSFAQEALGAEGRGWKDLKTNNINDELEDPLQYNKIDVMATGTQFIAQSHTLLRQAIERLEMTGDFDFARELAGGVRRLGTRF